MFSERSLREYKRKKKSVFSENLKQFPTILHFYSPKTFDYIGQKFALLLNLGWTKFMAMLTLMMARWKMRQHKHWTSLLLQSRSLGRSPLLTFLSRTWWLYANLDIMDMGSHFFHPEDHIQKVHVLLDPHHMLKLLRNVFSTVEVVVREDGQQIRWQYTEELHKLQEKEGLPLGNKLKMPHFQWWNQTMKVKIAFHLFSSSKSEALEYCELELKYPQLSGCGAKIQFLWTTDVVFDILNSRNPLGKGLLHGLSVKERLAFHTVHYTEKDTYLWFYCLLQNCDVKCKAVQRGMQVPPFKAPGATGHRQLSPL